MSLSSTRIAYSIGSAAWGSKSASEGITVLEHTEPQLVVDQRSSPVIAKSQRLPDGRDSTIGKLYYTWDLPVLFSQAHTRLILDKFFESTVAGPASNYTRTYQAEDIKADPVTPFANIWKKTAKPGHDRNLCCSNGIVTGISLSKSPGQPVRLTARYAFGARSFAEPDPGASAWVADRSVGNFVPPQEGAILCFISPPAGSWTAFKVTDFNVDLSCEFTPHFWGAQYPDRFTRGACALAGNVQLRDITDQVQTFSGWLEASTVKTLWFYFGPSASLYMNIALNAGGASEDDITRTGKFGFTGVYESTATYPSGFRFVVIPGRA